MTGIPARREPELRALEEVGRWAASGVRFAEDFEREYGFTTRETIGRTDAYRAVLGIIKRCLAATPEPDPETATGEGTA